MTPQQIYANRIAKARSKQYRTARTDSTHSLGLDAVYWNGHGDGLKLGYARGLWDMQSAEVKARTERP